MSVPSVRKNVTVEVAVMHPCEFLTPYLEAIRWIGETISQALSVTKSQNH